MEEKQGTIAWKEEDEEEEEEEEDDEGGGGGRRRRRRRTTTPHPKRQTLESQGGWHAGWRGEWVLRGGCHPCP